jgi:Actinobacteria/chloroflexi VLRF1 release factor
MKNPAAGGGRWVDVAPERFPTWVTEFGRRHGGAVRVISDEPGESVTFTAADGAVAECHPPFPPVTADARAAGTEAAARALAAHAGADRVVGVLLVRLGGYAVGVFAGSPPELVASKAGNRPVHGRSAAGGWSQHRFARRREKQAAEALGAAADSSVAVLRCRPLDAVVTGGDRRAIATLRDDPRLVPYLDRAVDRFLTVPDPRLAVLRETPRAFRAIRIRLTEPGPAPRPQPVNGADPAAGRLTRWPPGTRTRYTWSRATAHGLTDTATRGAVCPESSATGAVNDYRNGHRIARGCAPAA